MTYRGHIKNGVAVLDDPIKLADGTRVRVEVEEANQSVPPPGSRRGTHDWDAALKAAQALRETYDYDAVADQEACDRRDAENKS